jgi:hypothetical protein
MAISNKRLHIICGMCGSNEMIEYKISEEICDMTNEKIKKVSIICGNCSSLTGLDEVLKEIK